MLHKGRQKVTKIFILKLGITVGPSASFVTGNCEPRPVYTAGTGKLQPRDQMWPSAQKFD